MGHNSRASGGSYTFGLKRTVGPELIEPLVGEETAVLDVTPAAYCLLVTVLYCPAVAAQYIYEECD